MGEIDQISTNTLRYTMCSAPNVYKFVYTLIGAHIVPLTLPQCLSEHAVPFMSVYCNRQMFAQIDIIGYACNNNKKSFL